MFTLYKSSAGSGKTFTLVKEFLKICLQNPHQFASILAITFTNKAAAEMKTRIMGSLNRYITRGEDAIIHQVMEETDLTPEKAAANSRQLLERILHDYSRFSVMTIDSFISRIVRTFARDLDMPLTFDVELDTRALTEEIIERLLDEAEAGSFVGDLLTGFVLSKITTTGSWAVDGELLKIGDVVFKDAFLKPVTRLANPQYHDAFWKELIRIIEEGLNGFREEIRALADRGLDLIRESGLHDDDFAYKGAGTVSALQHFRHATRPQDMEFKSRLRDRKWMASKAPPEIKDRITALLEGGLNEVVDALEAWFDGSHAEYLTLYLIHQNIHALALVHRFIRLADAYKRETGQVPLSDFSRKVSDVVENEPVPFVYWRLGSQFNHLMLDEFQDTSRLQWQNLAPLLEESLARGELNLAVGDGKQAIYRWRAGDVTIMEEELGQRYGQSLEIRRLSHNYRSRHHIVTFNNHVFSHISRFIPESEHSLTGALYQDEAVKQKPAQDEPGRVTLIPMAFEKGAVKAEKQTLVLSRLCDEIEALLKEGNGYTLRDMAILVRYNKEATRVADFLAGRGIPVISPDSLLLNGSPVVRFLVAALRYVISDDRIALYTLWTFLKRDAESFQAMMRGDLSRREIEDALAPGFSRNKRLLAQRPVYEAAEEIIHTFELNLAHQGFLQGFLERVLGFTESKSHDIADFLEWWDAVKESDKATLASADHGNAVTLSTIHKAKGLEYPVVFLPFEWEMEASRKNGMVWVDGHHIGFAGASFPFLVNLESGMTQSLFRREYERETDMERLDNINLLYVALTRAAHRLTVFVSEDKKSTGSLLLKCAETLDMRTENDALVWGEPSSRGDAEAMEAIQQADTLPCSLWRSAITVKRSARDDWQLDDSPATERIDRGVLIHDVLSNILTEADIDRAAAEPYRQGRASRPDTAELTRQLHDLMEAPCGDGQVRDWFQPGLTVRTESFILHGSEEKRPDRVILMDDGAVVVDYKTGQPRPEHIQQVRAYQTLLKEMGHAPVQGFLLYLNPLNIVEV